jgi:hypothetical protein
MPLERALLCLNICAAVILAARLSVSHLGGIYRSFLLLVCYVAASEAVALAFRQGLVSFNYRIYWLALRPVEWALYIGVSYAVVRRLLTDHPGIYSVSKKITAGCFAIALAVSAFSAAMEYGSVGTNDIMVNVALVLQRAVCTGTLLVLVLSLAYLLWFPVEVPRNVAILSTGLVIYFASETTLLLARNVWSPDSLRLVSTLMMLISTACIVVWLFFLNSAGERTTVRPGHSWKTDDQQRVLARLEALNAALVRNARP